MIVVEVKAFY